MARSRRAFVAGAKGAAIVALVLPALAVLLPLFVFVLGLRLALAHAGLGLAGAIVFLEALMLHYDKAPFTSTYVPSEHAKALVPIYAIAFLIGASVFARMQSDVLRGEGAMTAMITLAALFAVLRLLSVTRPRLGPVDFDAAPATFQGLGLCP